MEKQKLFDLIKYLSFNTEKYAVGTHFYGDLDVNGRISLFEKRTGKKPAYVDFDMHGLPFYDENLKKKAVEELKSYVDCGGFVVLTDHWLTPKINYKNASIGGANNCRYILTKKEYYDVMTEGTELYKNFTDELDIKADFIKQLEKNNIPVIFRPLHEGNGEWFWWGVHPNENIMADDLINLYKFVHDYFSKRHKITNILWQMNTAMAGDKEFFAEWYAGDNYVELISTDWYLPEGDLKYYYDKTVEKCGDKPYAISELGGDGNYNASIYSLKETQERLEKFIKIGTRVSYVGFYFDMRENQDCTLSDYSITLDMMENYWDKI